jgi:hypothetical protein
VSPPNLITFGRDPNDLTNARGLLPNDRPNIFRFIGGAEVPHTGLVVAANMQHFTGKPWAATALITLPQGDQRIQLEPRGSRRLSSQSLLDLRVSRSISFGSLGRVVPQRGARQDRRPAVARRDDGPDCRADDRTGHSPAIAGAGHRRLEPQLW